MNKQLQQAVQNVRKWTGEEVVAEVEDGTLYLTVPGRFQIGMNGTRTIQYAKDTEENRQCAQALLAALPE